MIEDLRSRCLEAFGYAAGGGVGLTREQAVDAFLGVVAPLIPDLAEGENAPSR